MPKWLELFSKGYTDEEGNPAINPDDESLIVSILSLGTFLGALSAAPAAEFLRSSDGIEFCRRQLYLIWGWFFRLSLLISPCSLLVVSSLDMAWGLSVL